MKKLKIVIVLALAVVSVFLLASCNSVEISRVYVNEEMHAIVEYTDGTSKDLGYIGVEVIPPKYTVTFVDANGETLKTEKVYKGDAATAPTAPDVEDMAFERWDTDFSSVAGDITVRPVYIAAEEYTVTFVDENGAVIKTETVIHGKAANPPEAPLRENMIFKEWDKAFDSVTENLTVTAVYRNKETYTVTFKDYTGIKLGTVNVKEAGTAVAPVTPTRDGYTFAGWSSELSNVTENKTVTAKYNLKSGENIFDLAYTLNDNGTVTLKVALVGTVCFAGLEGEMALPSDISNATLKALGETTANIDGGKVRFTYTSATNITKSVELFTLTFTPADDSVTFALSVTDIYNQDFASVSYKVIGNTAKVK